jgi:hypothetical protein
MMRYYGVFRARNRGEDILITRRVNRAAALRVAERLTQQHPGTLYYAVRDVPFKEKPCPTHRKH